MTYLPSPACLGHLQLHTMLQQVYAGNPPALSPTGPLQLHSKLQQVRGPSSPWSKLPGQTDGLPLGRVPGLTCCSLRMQLQGASLGDRNGPGASFHFPL